MPIRTVVVDGDEATEVPDVISIVHHILLRIVRAIHEAGLRPASLLAVPPGNDVDDPAHRVRTIKQRARPANDFHLLHVGCHVGIGQGMAKESRPLRLPVEEDQHLVTSAHTADVNRPGRASRDTKPRDALLGDEQPRHLLGKHRQKRGLTTAFDPLPVDDRDGQRYTAPVHFDAVGRNHHTIQLDNTIYFQRRLCHRPRDRPESASQNYISSFHTFNYIGCRATYFLIRATRRAKK